MIADNIDNLQCTINGSGTSQQVNLIFVLEKKQKDKAETVEDKQNVLAKMNYLMWKILAYALHIRTKQHCWECIILFGCK